MRKKLNISHNALLKCSCQKDAGFSLNVDLLSHIKNSLDQTKQTLENYVSAIISNKVKGANTGNANHFVVTSSTQTEKIQMKNKRLQANTEKYKKGKDTCLCHVSVKKQEVELKDKENQKDFSSCHISANELEEKLKHKGTETDLSLCTLSVSKLKSELKDKTIHKGLLSIKDSSMQDMTSTLKYQSNSFLVQTSKNLKERPPLSVIHDSQANYNTISKGSTIKMLSGQHLKQKKMPAFQFYKDSPSGHNKENFQKIGFFSSDVKEKERSQKEKESEKEKRVRIFSPPEVHFFNQSAEDNDEDLKLRKRTSRLCYKEPAVNRKLTKSDPTVDRRFYISPHRKETFTAKRKYNTNNITRKRKRRRAKVAPIALEDIISIVEQSFQAGLLL